ncbi:hypothetical protein RB195_007924 [Necator americanus]|uniref:C2H2-type domain-containing protein n=1 Tax=Necator americanus TaxID=51031 RepID=A0ABR1BZN8_NECAM
MTLGDTRTSSADPSAHMDGVCCDFSAVVQNVVQAADEGNGGSDVDVAGLTHDEADLEELTEEHFEEETLVEDVKKGRQSEHASVMASVKAQRHMMGMGAFRCPPKYACLGCRGLLTEAQKDRHKLLGCDKGKDIKNAEVADLPPKHNGTFCSQCLAFYPTFRMLCQHYEQEHGLDCPVEEVLVKSETEFDQFYKWIQSEGGIKFIGTKTRTSRDGSRVYRFFQCCMVARGVKQAEELAKRGIKGRPLISCTAYVRRIPQDDGTFIVEYCSVHSHGLPMDEPAVFFNAEKFVRRRRKRTPDSNRRRSSPIRCFSPGSQRMNTNAVGTWHSPRTRKRSAAMQRAIEDNYFSSHEMPYVSEQDETGDNTPDIKPSPMLKLTNNDEDHSPTRKRGRQRSAKTTPNSSRSKLSTLPPEMTQQFVPILEDLASDATDAHDKFEELKNFVPRRSLARFRNQR